MKPGVPINRKTDISDRWQYFLIGSINVFFTGIIYIWPRLRVPLEAEVGPFFLAEKLDFAFMLCFFCLGGMVAGQLKKWVSAQNILLLSAILVLIGSFAMFRSGTYVKIIWFFYNVIVGAGIGMAHNTVFAVACAWFPDKKWICPGVLIFFWGIGAPVLQNVVEFLFNCFGWRRAYVIFGMMIAAVFAFSGYGMRYPETRRLLRLLQPDGLNTKQSDSTMKNDAYRTIKNCLAVCSVFLFLVLSSIAGNVVLIFDQDYDLPAYIINYFFLCCSIGCILCSLFFKLLKYKKILVVSVVVTISALLLLLLAVYSGFLFLCIVGVALVGIEYGFSFAGFYVCFNTAYKPNYSPFCFNLAKTVFVPVSFSLGIAYFFLILAGSYMSAIIILLLSVALAISFSIISIRCSRMVATNKTANSFP